MLLFGFSIYLSFGTNSADFEKNYKLSRKKSENFLFEQTVKKKLILILKFSEENT